METELFPVLIIIAVAIPTGYVAGNAAVYAFNRIPATWLVDYDEIPDEKAVSEGKQRVKSVPWKYVFAASFIVVGIYLGLKNWLYAIPAMIALWLLLLVALGDVKYKIIPDQLCFLLAITAMGFVPFHDECLNILWGAVLGFSAVVAVNFAGKLIFKRDAIGFGDAKLCGVLGLILGWKWIGIAMVAGAFLAGIWAAAGLLTKRLAPGDEQPLGHFIAAAAGVVIIFFF